MNKIFSWRQRALLSLVAALVTTYAVADPVAANHPILGGWKFAVPDHDCIEDSFFGPDGNVHIVSGAEVTESAFEISAQPGESGFYQYSDTVTKSNGLEDCTGHTTPEGANTHLFIHFLDDGNSYLMCQTESFDSCFGPVQRSSSNDS